MEDSARAQMTKYWMVGLGGFFGSIARFWLGHISPTEWERAFRMAHFVINISGSFLIGLVVTLLAERTHWSPNLLYLIPIGFIGAYTTFSTFELEAFRSVRQRRSFVGVSVRNPERGRRIHRGLAWSRRRAGAGVKMGNDARVPWGIDAKSHANLGPARISGGESPLDSFACSYQNGI